MKSKFKLGERVKVLPKEEILKMLGEQSSIGSKLFMDQMWNYCGNEYEIIKIVKYIYHRKMQKARFPLYMLEGLICNGMINSFGQRCDRSCYFLWLDSWLEKS